MAHYLICYDIANPKRLAKVHRRTVAFAMFVQYSVYYFEGSHETLKAALEDLQAVIDENADDIRAYSIAPLPDAIRMGISWLPEGILVSS
jgi:CRISPR-associated protein Cas2